MADFDSFDYDIAKKLPEWWKGFGALEPVNEYTQQLIANILQGLLTTMGVVQPLNCWLTIPEEYNWYHHYKATDDYLKSENGEFTINNSTTVLFKENKVIAQLPDTKRNCHAKILLKLLGTTDWDINKEEVINRKEIIEELIITNADQQIILKNIKPYSTIEILTETNEILIDGVVEDNLIEGSFHKIKPTIKYSDYKEPYIDKNEYYPIQIQSNDFDETLIDKNFYLLKENIESSRVQQIFRYDNKNESNLYIKLLSEINNEENEFPSYQCYFLSKDGKTKYGTGVIKIIDVPKKNLERYKDIDVEDENKKTEIVIDSSQTVNFDLQVYLKKPTYTTEQNIRIASVSAFPIEWVRLYGYFCHPFNNKVGYKFLWEKKYTEDSRTVFDRITKQYDCERFYIQVKFYGIGTPLTKGFPQTFGETNAAFQPNPNLDKWGKIYGLPRRVYKPDINEEEEPFTFPKYYPYPLEQDYWYEERMVNEYCFNDEAVNSLFIRDDDFNNIGMLECIYPFMNDIWVYTETIDPKDNKKHEIREIPLCSASQDEYSPGVSWGNPQKLINKALEVRLNPKSNEILKLNDESYQTKKLKCSFCLNPYDDEVPKDITIKGIELKFKTETSVQSQTIKLSDESRIIIPYISPNLDNPVLEKIPIIHDEEIWMKDKGYYTIGGEDNLFQEPSITREQLFKGNDGKLDFELVFVNENDFLESILYLEDITLNIYYEIIPNNYNIDVSFDTKEIDLKKRNEINMTIDVENKGNIEIHDKNILIILPYELKLKNEHNSFDFNLDVNEKFSIKNIVIQPNSWEDAKTGRYDILVFCEDKVILNEILVRGKE